MEDQIQDLLAKNSNLEINMQNQNGQTKEMFEYQEKLERDLQKMVQRDEIISKQYRHYKELYQSKDTLTRELESVITDLTNQIEKEKRKKEIEEQMKRGNNLID